ncbi:MAG: hypothetical protein SFV54_16605 [Bryobacteraceae bacterium]|nr:hypothetical protein [Bryobacteraceae bacterium]
MLTWLVPGRPFTVQLSPHLPRFLAHHTRQSFRRPAAGVLIGAFSPGPPALAEVQFLQPLPQDLPAASNLIDRWCNPAHGHSLALLGCYCDIANHPEQSFPLIESLRPLLSPSPPILLRFGPIPEGVEVDISIYDKGTCIPCGARVLRAPADVNPSRFPPPSPRRSPLPWITVALLAPLVAFVGWRSLLPATTPEPSPLLRAAPSASPVPAGPPLEIQRHGSGAIQIRWNPAFPLTQEADSALLRILDGASSEETRMAPARLRHGSLIYSPVTADLTVSLDLFQGSAILSTSSIRVFLPDSAGRPLTVVRPAATPAPLPAPASPRTVFTPPPAQATGPQPVLEAPPSLTAESTSRQPASTSLLSSARVAAVAPPAPAPQVLPPPTAAPAADPAPVPVRPPQVVPARPVAHPTVVLPAHLWKLIINPAEVHIEVDLDATGRVVAATTANPNAPLVGLLAPLCRDAARRAAYVPSTIDGRPSPSKLMLRFRFNPASR